MSELAKDAVNESSIISKVFSKEVFEFLLCYQIFGLEIKLLLELLLDHCFAEKQNGKRAPIWPINPGKIAFILLAEIIAI